MTTDGAQADHVADASREAGAVDASAEIGGDRVPSGMVDAGRDAPMTTVSKNGCSCATATDSGSREAWGGWWASLGLVIAAANRRRRRR